MWEARMPEAPLMRNEPPIANDIRNRFLSV
jgi:hypothetical protein